LLSSLCNYHDVATAVTADDVSLEIGRAVVGDTRSGATAAGSVYPEDHHDDVTYYDDSSPVVRDVAVDLGSYGDRPSCSVALRSLRRRRHPTVNRRPPPPRRI